MTTIVSNLECMAADQRCTGGGPMCHVKKIHRVGDSLFGFAGDAVLALHIIKWLGGKRDPIQLYKLIPEAHRSDVDVLELSPDGLAFWNGWGVRMPLLDATFAIGSGAMAALQALRMNSSPEEAVLHAMKMDEMSGAISSPSVEYLLPPELTKRKRRG